MMGINVGPKHVEQITSSIKHFVASSWFSSSHYTQYYCHGSLITPLPPSTDIKSACRQSKITMGWICSKIALEEKWEQMSGGIANRVAITGKL